MRRLGLALVLAALGVMVGCGGTGGGSSPAPAAAATTKSHIVVIVMENKEYGQVIGSRSAPYLTSLAHRYVNATNFHGIRHPSLPNYLGLVGGATFGVDTDCTDCIQSAPNLVDQLERARLSWRGYMGGYPGRCFKGGIAGEYAKKHNPFLYFRSVADNPRRCAKIVSGGQIERDARARRLPTFSFLSPGLCDDTHDCAISSGDRYLARVVPPILSALGRDGFLVITYDEGTSDEGGGGRVPTVIAGPRVKRGAAFTAPRNHYSTLRTVEDALRLRALGFARAAQPLDGAFREPPRLR